jgi:hypothetical protein
MDSIAPLALRDGSFVHLTRPLEIARNPKGHRKLVCDDATKLHRLITLIDHCQRNERQRRKGIHRPWHIMRSEACRSLCRLGSHARRSQPDRSGSCSRMPTRLVQVLSKNEDFRQVRLRRGQQFELAANRGTTRKQTPELSPLAGGAPCRASRVTRKRDFEQFRTMMRCSRLKDLQIVKAHGYLEDL